MHHLLLSIVVTLSHLFTHVAVTVICLTFTPVPWSRCRHWFLGFVVCVLVNIYITDYLCYHILNEFGWDWVVVIGSTEAGILTVAVTGLTCMMVSPGMPLGFMFYSVSDTESPGIHFALICKWLKLFAMFG